MEIDESFDAALDRTEPKRPGLLVLLAGVATSAATLALMYVLDQVFPNFHPMGWYVNLIIPAGAMLVGFVAGSGYGIASWLTGARIGKGLLWQIVVLQVAVYFCSQYVEFLLLKEQLGNIPISFWQYFDAMTRAFAFNKNGQPGPAFGAWGYGMRALEIGGFSLCGLIAPAILSTVPYCEKCQVYMKSKALGLLPAGIAPRKIRKKDVEEQQAFDEEHRAALEAGQKRMEQVVESITAKDARRFSELLEEHAGDQKEIEKQTSRISVGLEHCRLCHAGRVTFKLLSGQGDAVQTVDLGRSEVDAHFTENMLHYRESR